MTARERSEAALEMARNRYMQALRYATGARRVDAPNEYAMRRALRAAYAVDKGESK